MSANDDPKDKRIEELEAEVKKLRAKLIDQMNYSLQLDRQLQTGEIEHG